MCDVCVGARGAFRFRVGARSIGWSKSRDLEVITAHYWSPSIPVRASRSALVTRLCTEISHRRSSGRKTDSLANKLHLAHIRPLRHRPSSPPIRRVFCPSNDNNNNHRPGQTPHLGPRIVAHVALADRPVQSAGTADSQGGAYDAATARVQEEGETVL